jgi:AcrR family transcriptional regulator
MEAANDLVRQGKIPSVVDVAEAATVSRATAYRYFPTPSALLEALVAEIRVPAPDYDGVRDPSDSEARIQAYVETVVPHMETVESQLRAALRLSLEQWSKALAGDVKEGRPIRRGRRIALLEPALAPIKEQLDKTTFRRLMMTLSILLGIEALVVLKDIWGLSGSEAKDVMQWASQILVHAVTEDAQEGGGRLRPRIGLRRR